MTRPTGSGRRDRGGDRTVMPSSGLYNREYYLSRACDGLSEYLAGSLSIVRRRELDRLDVRPGHVILDLGCGRAESAGEARRRGARVVALDYSWDAVELARAVLGDVAAVVQADASALPFRADAFDRILAGDVIEHLPWDAGVAALREARRVLAPAGRALLHTSPNTWFIRVVKPPLQLVLRLLRRTDPLHRFAEYDRLRAAMHPNELSPRSLPRLLRAAGIRGRSWVDRDVLRSGSSEWTAGLAPGPIQRAVATAAGCWPLRLVLGNDLYAVFGKD